MAGGHVSWVVFDLNGTLPDPSGIAGPLGATDENRRVVAGAFHEALLLTMAATLSGGEYRPLSEYLCATLERALRARGRRTDVLDAAMEHAAEMDPFPDSEEPDPRVYGRAVERLGAQPTEIVLVAAHGWDVMGAMRAALRGAWVARSERWLVPIVPEPDVSGEDLADVADRISELGR